MDIIERPELLEQVRSRIRAGESAVEVVQFLIRELSLDCHSRLIIVAYLKAAIGLPVEAVRHLVEWHFFRAGEATDEMVNAEVTPVMAALVAKAPPHGAH
jgi:hypothetical protein